MSSIYQRLREALPAAKFFSPAMPEQIARVEGTLCVRFPDWLRDLYLRSNGILPADSSGAYLYPLERNDDCCESILSWNQFLRSQWVENLPEYARYQPEVEWSKLDPQRLLIIGSDGGVDWAIHPEGGMEIVCYDVRNPECRNVIAQDLIDACVEQEEFSYEIGEDLFRGRELYRGDNPTSPAATDIDRLFDIIVALHKAYNTPPGIHVGTGWWLHRAISQRPGELGELFIIPRGSDDEIRIFTLDGNLPFVMRLTARPFAEDFCCVVGSLKGALINILSVTDTISIPWVDGKRPSPDEAKIREAWQEKFTQPRSDMVRMADVLIARDNRRRVEENRRESGGS